MTLIILDRDGVINEDSPNYIKSAEEWIPIPGSLEAIAKLTQAGITIAVATNQSGIARGFYSIETLEAIHHKMKTEVSKAGGDIAAIFFCPHGPDDQCNCRKPKPGLLNAIHQHFNQPLSNTWAIGDSLRDLQAATRAGCCPILVLTGNGKKTQSALETPVPTYANLAKAVDAFLQEQP